MSNNETIIAATKGLGLKSSKDSGPQQYKKAGKKPAKQSGPRQYKKGS
jgi:hypothetical protein